MFLWLLDFIMSFLLKNDGFTETYHPTTKAMPASRVEIFP